MLLLDPKLTHAEVIANKCIQALAHLYTTDQEEMAKPEPDHANRMNAFIHAIDEIDVTSRYFCLNGPGLRIPVLAAIDEFMHNLTATGRVEHCLQVAEVNIAQALQQQR